MNKLIGRHTPHITSDRCARLRIGIESPSTTLVGDRWEASPDFYSPRVNVCIRLSDALLCTGHRALVSTECNRDSMPQRVWYVGNLPADDRSWLSKPWKDKNSWRSSPAMQREIRKLVSSPSIGGPKLAAFCGGADLVGMNLGYVFQHGVCLKVMGSLR